MAQRMSCLLISLLIISYVLRWYGSVQVAMVDNPSISMMMRSAYDLVNRHVLLALVNLPQEHSVVVPLGRLVRVEGMVSCRLTQMDTAAVILRYRLHKRK